MKYPFILILLFFLIAADATHGVPRHNAMDEKLTVEWNRIYPVPFDRIVKRDLESKGALLFRTDHGKTYIYSFVVYMPDLVMKEDAPVATGKGREIVVRLYYFPGAEKEFEVKIGKFVETLDKKRMIGWVRSEAND